MPIIYIYYTLILEQVITIRAIISGMSQNLEKLIVGVVAGLANRTSLHISGATGNQLNSVIATFKDGYQHILHL